MDVLVYPLVPKLVSNVPDGEYLAKVGVPTPLKVAEPPARIRP